VDTTIKVDAAIRDRLAQIARERGMTTRDLVAELARATLTRDELRERATAAAEYLRARVAPDLTDADISAGVEVWRAIEAGGCPEALAGPDASAGRAA
jgi:predicted DNA-binding ribbon-helix-helix protein